MKKNNKKKIKQRNFVVYNMILRTGSGEGFHSSKKYSRKQKHKKNYSEES